MAETAPPFCIGSTANLILGYKAIWNASDIRQLPFYPPSYQEFLHFPVDSYGSKASWGALRVELCPTKEELFGKLCDYRVIAEPEDGTSIPIGPLLEKDIRSSQTIDQFFRETGINVSKSSTQYALLIMERTGRAFGHPSIEKLGFGNALFYKNEVMSHTLRRELVKLQSALNSGPTYQSISGKWQRRTDAIGVQRFIDFFNDYGSHYVSKVITGDVIYQIFAYEAEAFSLIHKLFKKTSYQLDYTTVLSFQKFTRPLRPLAGKEKGYASQIGHLCIKSKDESFLKCAATDRWMDIDLGKNSIFNCAADPDQLRIFSQLIPIGFELSEILGFTRPALKAQGNSIFKALMFTMYEDKISFFFKNQQVTPSLNSQVNRNTNNRIVATSDNCMIVYKNVLETDDIESVKAENVKELRLLSPLFHIGAGGTFRLAGDFIHIMAHTLSVGEKPREVVLTDQAFNSIKINCEDFNGALRIRNESTGATYTIVDGFKYQAVTDSADPSQRQVLLRGEINASVPASVVASLMSGIEHTLLMAENMLESTGDTFSDSHKIFITRYLNWLSDLMPPRDNAFSNLRLQAHWLARVIAKIELPEIGQTNYCDPAIEDAVRKVDDASIYVIKNSLTIQQQLFLIQQDDGHNEKKQALLMNLFRKLRSIVDGYAALSKVRQLILEKKRDLTPKLIFRIDALERDLENRQTVFLESVRVLEAAIPAAKITESLKAIFLISTACLLSEAPAGIEKFKGNATLARWFNKSYRLQNLRNTLLVLTTTDALNKGMPEILADLGRNGLMWLREKEWREVAEDFQSLIYTEVRSQVSDQFDRLLEILVNDFRAIIHSGRMLADAQARLLHIHYYSYFQDYYEARHTSQADALI
ncbi:MAG: hypothetical protein H7246_04615, partial [Phycisphaerae bacterium]|nr:hypothetical protein [Saprospiraceae bacterium]